MFKVKRPSFMPKLKVDVVALKVGAMSMWGPFFKSLMYKILMAKNESIQT